MTFYIILFSFISGILCAMGFGGGTVLIIFLTAALSFEQTRAQGINLMFFLPCAVYSLIIYNKEKLIDRKKILPLALGGIIGIFIGYLLLEKIATGYLSKLFGGFVVISGLRQLLSGRKRNEKK